MRLLDVSGNENAASISLAQHQIKVYTGLELYLTFDTFRLGLLSKMKSLIIRPELYFVSEISHGDVDNDARGILIGVCVRLMQMLILFNVFCMHGVDLRFILF
jgi:hypothetical protein